MDLKHENPKGEIVETSNLNLVDHFFLEKFVKNESKNKSYMLLFRKVL